MDEPKGDKAHSYERRRQVLRLLAEHGPLSADGIEACLPQTSSRRALRDVLKRLYQRGILARRHDQVTRRVFHQIGQQPFARRQAAEILGMHQDHLNQPHFRHAELLHSQDCAAWTEMLRLLFPRAKVRREHQFASDPAAQSALLARADERDLLPDILLAQEAQAPCDPVWVAIEVERTFKSKARLHRKLHTYANKTRLDGLIYVTGRSSLQSRLLDIYQSKVMQRALRISHYGRHFLLFADGSFDRDRGEPQIFNSSGDAVSLREWMRVLLETKNARRPDSIFQESTLHG